MADKQDTKDEIIPVGPGVDEPQDTTQESVDSGYRYPEGEDDDEPVDRAEAGDERTGHGEEEEPEDRSGRPLSREQKRRQRRREKYDRLEQENRLLQARNEQLERENARRLAAVESRQTQSDVLAIDGRISQTESDLRETEALYKQARQQNDAEAEMLALRARDELSEGLRQLKAVKAQTQRAAQVRETAAAQPNAPDPAVAARADAWRRENSWFDLQRGDEASLVAYAIEQAVFREGRLSPASDAYWDEIDRRLEKRLPERYRHADSDDEYDTPDDRVRRNGRDAPQTDRRERRPSGPTIKVGGRERALRKGEVFIDEARKEALIEAGKWDDPKARERALRYYQEHDRNANRRPR